MTCPDCGLRGPMSAPDHPGPDCFCMEDDDLMAHETPNHPGYKYFVLYGDNVEWFACMADDAKHAAEQCWDYAHEDIHGVWRGAQEDSWVGFFQDGDTSCTS